MRPRSISLGEALYALAIVLVLIGSVMTWRVAAAHYGSGIAIGTVLVAVLLPLALLLGTTRGRSRIALVLLTLWTLFGAWSVLRELVAGTRLGLVGGLTLVQIVLMVLGLALLLGKPARQWIAGRPGSGGRLA